MIAEPACNCPVLQQLTLLSSSVIELVSVERAFYTKGVDVAAAPESLCESSGSVTVAGRIALGGAAHLS